MKLQGIFLPLTVPFDHHGDLYAVKVQHNVEKWNRTGLAGYVVCGCENLYLTSEEKIQVWEWVAEYAAPGKLLIASVGMPGVKETVALANRAEPLGYKAAVVRAPRGSQEMQLIYFRAVADQARIPIIMEGGVPQNSLQHQNVIAVIEDSVREAGQPALPRLAGSAANVAQSLAAGAAGAVLDLANAIPYAAISIWEAHRTRDAEAALDWQNRIAPADELIRSKYGLAGLKTAMDLNGYYGGPPRLPLTVLTPGQRQEIQQAFDGIKG